MKQYIYRIQPVRIDMLSNGPTEEESAVVSEHFAYLRDLSDEGVVIMAGRTLNTDPSSFGIVILRAESDKEAEERMMSDPAVAKGVMKSEIFPFRVAFATEGGEDM